MALADKAERVFKDGKEDLKAALNAGELSISAAYDRLPRKQAARTGTKRARGGAKANQTTREAGAASDGASEKAGDRERDATTETDQKSQTEDPRSCEEDDKRKREDGTTRTDPEEPQDGGSGDRGRRHADSPEGSASVDVRQQIQIMAAENGIELWTPYGILDEDLDDLDKHMRHLFRRLMDRDPTAALERFRRHEQMYREILVPPPGARPVASALNRSPVSPS